MSTVTLSKPHCAITSAEKPEGIASHALTAALPEAQTFLTLLAIDRVSLCGFSKCCGSLVRGPLDADFADADLACSIHYRRPGIVGQGYSVFGAFGAHFPLGIAGDQHALDAGNRLGRPDEVDIARDLAVEEMAGIDHLGIDIEGQHAIGKTAVRRGGAVARQRAAEQLADKGKPRALVLAEGADRA